MKAHITTLVLVSAMRAGAANAQTVDTTAHLRRGVALRREGHDDEARAEFQAAYAATRSPIAAGQLGFAQQALGQWVNAEAHVREALAAANDEWVRRNHPALESAYATIQQHVGQLEVDGEPPGAEVYVGGVGVGTVPMAAPVRLERGTVTLEVRAPGFYPVLRAVQLLDGDHITREVVALRRWLPALGDPTASSTSSSPTSHALRVTPWAVGLLVTGLAALAVGVVSFAGPYASDVGQYASYHCSNSTANPMENPRCDGWSSGAVAWSIGGGIAFAIGAASVAGGLFALWRDQPMRPPSPRASARVHQ